MRFLLAGESPTLDATRVSRSVEMLFQDLERQGLDGFKFERNVTVTVPGLRDVIAPILATRRDGARFVLGLHGPLTPDEPVDEALRELKEYSTALPLMLIDEMVVRRNLASVTSGIITRLG
jgi:hypothetical protein